MVRHAEVNVESKGYISYEVICYKYSISIPLLFSLISRSWRNIHTEREVSTSFLKAKDLFAQDAHSPSIVRVTSKVYRRVALYEPGEYVATLNYYNGTQTVANWLVRPLQQQKRAKSVILFICDGMTTNMITAARLIGHKSINGKYHKFPVLGHQMTHSLDSYITDSVNSASALYSEHRSTVNALGGVETIVEILTRIWGSAIGVVSTAFIADATPIALNGHTRLRSQYGNLIDQALRGVTNYTWTPFSGPDVFFGAGAKRFIAGSRSFQGKDYYNEFANSGYTVSLNKTSLLKVSNATKALGIFCTSNLQCGNKKPVLDLPGLKEMTLKAIDILYARGGDKGFFMMSEAASIDKHMHTLDYHRALGDLLELDDTVNATKLKLDQTLIIVTADHGHGFVVFGSADTKYLSSKFDDREKRNAIVEYTNSGLSQYTVTNASISYNTGANFPVNWNPRYTLAQDVGANPDHRENYRVHKSGPRLPATNVTGFSNDDYFICSSEAQGVHSLTDVPVFAMGPCQELFGGVYGNIDIFFNMANCLGLARPNNATGTTPSNGAQRGLRAGMLVFQMAIGWVALSI
ncbi:alkaline phosphatase-like protein [Mollisia scopiformis]|uniref:alkaline phosphatase n=1 Tax=Mollisia scopiformis TaxID=149040 RepID=A0A194XN03_MOLSC|nr:alkaline phosphatase-like protein [Mollisia scopiformis]KUJ21506.1 alkaline phosphatase-like protein [Mollisia scopiformis]